MSIFKEKKLDLIITDFNMPVMNEAALAECSNKIKKYFILDPSISGEENEI